VDLLNADPATWRARTAGWGGATARSAHFTAQAVRQSEQRALCAMAENARGMAGLAVALEEQFAKSARLETAIRENPRGLGYGSR